MQLPELSTSRLATRLRTLVVALIVVTLIVEGPLRGAGGLPAWVSVDGQSSPSGTALPGEQHGDPVLAAAKRKRAKKGGKHRAGEKKGRKAGQKSKQDKHDKKKDDQKSRAKRDGRGKDHDGNRNAHKKDKARHDRDGKNPNGKDGKRARDTGRDAKRGDDKQDQREKTKHRSSDTDATARIASASAPLTFVPVADAQVSEANPNYNYGTRTRLLVDGGREPNIAAYLRFDVAGVTARVQQATLRLRVRDSNGTRDGPELRATGADWTESVITWNDRPAPADGILDDKAKLDEGSWVEYDVTSAVRGDGSVGFVLLPQSNDGVFFQSREGDRSPELVVTLQDPTPLPSPEPSPTPTSEPDQTLTPEPTATSEPTVLPDPTATPEPTADPTAILVPTPTAEPTATPEPTPPPDPGASATLLAAGDIASCSSDGDEATAALLDGLEGTVATLGDHAYEQGSARQFAECYAPSWGRHKARTRPAVGNHEYETGGAAGYFAYFGAAAGDPKQGYYSYDLGAWHVVVLNSNCSQVGGCGAGSAQEQWLRQDLAANPAACTLAYWHHPRYSFGRYGNDARTQALWQALAEHGAELVLTGHDHTYQRYAPLDPGGNRDPDGIRQFVVGTGGRGLYPLGNPPATVQASNDTALGLLRLTLEPDRYAWEFVPEAGSNYSDSGSDACH